MNRTIWPGARICWNGAARSRMCSGIWATNWTTKPRQDAPFPAGYQEEVAVIASVRVNGQSVGTVWSPPYSVDVTQAIKPGKNQLTVEVTSTWFNRLIYDSGLNEADRKTWTINGPAKNSALVSSGLLGPVTIRIGRQP